MILCEDDSILSLTHTHTQSYTAQHTRDTCVIATVQGNKDKLTLFFFKRGTKSLSVSLKRPFTHALCLYVVYIYLATIMYFVEGAL